MRILSRNQFAIPDEKELLALMNEIRNEKSA